MRNFPRYLSRCRIIGFAILIGISANSASAEDIAVGHSLANGNSASIIVPLFKSRVIRLEQPAARISVGNPDIADILILRATQLYVLGKDLGTTNVILWDRNDNLIGTVSVEVSHDLISLKAKLHELLPNEPINAYSSQRSIVLTGQVSSPAAMTAAVSIAEGYLAQIGTATEETQFDQQSASRREDKAVGEVINLMQVGGGQQVMLEVKVAEIARTELRSLDARFNLISKSTRWTFGGVNGGATFPDFLNEESLLVPVMPGTAPWGPAIDSFTPNDLAIDDKGLFASYFSDDFLFNMALNAAKEKGLAKILAEPTLTTLTGQEAKFLSGGEFPIPVPNGLNGITIEFKEFGVGLKFLPVVLGGDIINMKLNVTVSELVDANSVIVRAEDTLSTFLIPALTKRSANATFELKDGQTIAMAGLINENLREVINKFPGLGDLPVLGALFRSQDFVKGETELVILVTPRLAKPIAPHDIRLPTDDFIEPSERDFYLFGRIEGTSAGSVSIDTQDTQAAGGTESNFGHQVQ